MKMKEMNKNKIFNEMLLLVSLTLTSCFHFNIISMIFIVNK